MSNSIQVKILGREYSLRSQQSDEQVQRVSAFIEELLTETVAGRAVDTRDAAALTLLNLAGRYLQLLDKQNKQDLLDSRLNEMVVQLENKVSGC